MDLVKRIQERREVILERWFEAIVKTYPADASRFFVGERDRFRNPVGHAFRRSTAVLLTAITDGVTADELKVALDDVVRLRAVQDWSPSQAVSFIFLLKQVLRREFAEELEREGGYDRLLDIEGSIDGLALRAFDNYLRCKESIYDIRAREAHRRTAKLVEQVNRLYPNVELGEPGPEKRDRQG